MMTSWSVLLVALICVAMMAVMCLSMTVGMIRKRRRRGPDTTTTSPSDEETVRERS